MSCQSHNGGEKDPGSHIVYGGARDRDRTDPSAEQIPLSEDAGKHWERGDAHSRANE